MRPGAATPVRDAATVVLLRDGSDGVEVWLLTRVHGMAFAPGMSVFPGGRLEGDDAQTPVAGFVRSFPDDTVPWRTAVAAAARETFEESGILLTAPVVTSSYEPERASVESGLLPFSSFLRRHGLTVDGNLLAPWDRWITPPTRPRRYDTRFFIAELPRDSAARDVSTEASSASWVSVQTALAEEAQGSRGLMRPTRTVLSALNSFESVAAIRAAAPLRALTAVRPVELPPPV